MALPPTQDGQDDISTAADKHDKDQERRRSNVRIYVTYLMATLFASMATVLIVWLAWQREWSEAISIFTSVSAMAGGVIGYWFGNRGASKPFPSTNELAPPSPEQVKDEAEARAQEARHQASKAAKDALAAEAAGDDVAKAQAPAKDADEARKSADQAANAAAAKAKEAEEAKMKTRGA